VSELGAANPPRTGTDLSSGARPLVGLVLSGGGARGGAHLGVLKALEDLRIPVDYIAGTSIGAAIGGLYASGMTSNELDEFLNDIDWNAAFLNVTPRELRSFRRKRDDDLFLVNQRPGLNDGEFSLPQGVVQGQVIDTIMTRVTLPTAGITNFDDLRIPFRAVAGDLETGEAVVLGGGELGRAIRASMTVPAALAPIEVDGRLLIDGGIAMNLPVEVAQAMGADVIIAIDISDDLSTRDELRSVVDVTAQLSSLLTRQGTAVQLEKLGERDIWIRPAFGDDQTSLDFSQITATIDTGYDAVMGEAEALAWLAMTEPEYAAHVAERSRESNPTMPVIDFIRIVNDSLIADSVIEARLREIEVGVPLDVDALETTLNRLYGLELYQNVRYRILEEADSTGLELELIERGWGPNYLQLGIQYSSASDENAKFGLAASYLRTAINRLNGELRATIGLGDEPSFLTDLYQPLGPEALYFVSPSIRITSSLLNVFDDKRLASEVRVREATFELGLGRELMDWGEIRAGFRTGYGDAELRVGEPGLVPYDDFRSGEIFARFSIDTLDSIAFPRSGVLSSIEWRGSRTGVLAADVPFDQILIDTSYARTWGRHTMLTSLRYESTVSGEAPLYRVFRVGGLFDISGLNSEQLFGQHVARIGAGYYRRIGDLALFPAFAGVSLELGNAWNSRDDISVDSAIVGGSLWAGVDTPVGPIYLAWGLAEGGQDAFYVFMGRVF
jgi:NTE family protein